jgi:hypothetical protein
LNNVEADLVGHVFRRAVGLLNRGPTNEYPRHL